ncbi:MAG: hypothetical protein ACRENG_16235, partial [bacterium]
RRLRIKTETGGQAISQKQNRLRRRRFLRAVNRRRVSNFGFHCGPSKAISRHRKQKSKFKSGNQMSHFISGFRKLETLMAAWRILFIEGKNILWQNGNYSAIILHVILEESCFAPAPCSK